MCAWDDHDVLRELFIYTGKRTRLVNEPRIPSKPRYEPRLRATPRKRVVYEPRALSSVL